MFCFFVCLFVSLLRLLVRLCVCSVLFCFVLFGCLEPLAAQHESILKFLVGSFSLRDCLQLFRRLHPLQGLT